VDIIIKSINDKKTFKKTFNLAGPKKYTLYEVIKLITKCDKKYNIIIGLNKTMSYLFVRLLMLSPVKIITTDNLKSMETSNTVRVNHSYSFKRSLKELSTYLINYKKY
jgi:NADH dehydrogenase